MEHSHRISRRCGPCVANRGIAGLLIGLAAVGGVIHLSSQSKYIPFVVEVNKLGEPLAISQAQLLKPVDPRVIQQELGAFISQARRVTPDFTLERDGNL